MKALPMNMAWAGEAHRAMVRWLSGRATAGRLPSERIDP